MSWHLFGSIILGNNNYELLNCPGGKTEYCQKGEEGGPRARGEERIRCLLNKIDCFQVYGVGRLGRRALGLRGNPTFNKGQDGFQVLKSLANLVRLQEKNTAVSGLSEALPVFFSHIVHCHLPKRTYFNYIEREV